MTLTVVVGLSNLGPDGQASETDMEMDPLMTREAAETLLGQLREEGVRPPAVAMDRRRDPWSTRSTLTRANVFLASLGLPTHDEPAHSPPWEPALPPQIPLQALYRLRRAMAMHLIWPDRPLEPLAPDQDARTDPVMAQVERRLDNHLIHHADREGFFLPISFSQAVHDPTGMALAGSWLGSSLRLAEEMHELAPLLDLAIADGADGPEVPAEVIARITRERDASDPLHLERWAWLVHVQAAHQSIRDGTAIIYR